MPEEYHLHVLDDLPSTVAYVATVIRMIFNFFRRLSGLRDFVSRRSSEGCWLPSGNDRYRLWRLFVQALRKC